MANNYMWLVHIPTGKRCQIAARHGCEWMPKSQDVNVKMSEFFNEVYDHETQDNFTLVMERSGTPLTHETPNKWDFSDEMLAQHLFELCNWNDGSWL